MGFPWTQEKINQLKNYWSVGYTASEIADKMGNSFTRNSIIGKAHRLGLKKRGHEYQRITISKRIDRHKDEMSDEEIDQAIDALLSCKGSQRSTVK